MPLEQRVIQPIYVSRGCFSQDSKANFEINELECVTNGTLANIIRQLSNLSSYAEDLFGNILSDVTETVQRTSRIQTRLDSLVDKVVQLDSAEEVSSTFRDLYHIRKPYRSKADVFDQQVVSRITIPRSLREVYANCDPPPALSKLNPFREDNTDGLKLYTNPGFFFELWREEMLENRGRSKPSKKHATNAINQNGGSSQNKSRRKYVRNQASIQSNDSGTQYADSPQRVAPSVTAVQSNAQLNQHIMPQQQQQQQYPIYSENGVPITSYQTGANARMMSSGNDYQQMNPYYQQQQQHPEMIMQMKREEPNPNGKGTYSVIEGSYIDPNNYQHHYKHQYNNNQQQHYDQQQIMVGKQRPDSLELNKQQQMYQDHYGMGMQAKGGQDYNAHYHQQQQQRSSIETQQYSTAQMTNANNLTPTRRSALLSRPSQPPPAPPEGGSGSGSANNSGPPTPSHKMVINGEHEYDSHQQTRNNNREYLPPPPPMPMNIGASGGHDAVDNNLPPPPPMPNGNDEVINSPPPPPPPPMNLMSNNTNNNSIGNGILQQNESQKQANNTIRGAGNLTAAELQSVKLKKAAPPNQHRPDPVFEARTNLLDAIRSGVKLKKVEESKAKENEKTAPLHDVASILARRVALEMSDSEAENASEADDSDEWNDESEC